MGNPFGSSGDGKKPDGVTTYPANEHDLQSYVDASRQLSQLSAPVLLGSSNPHERIFIAAFDGTGNDMSKDEASGHMTNVALMRRQILQAFPNTNDPIRVGYVEGPGTQDGFIARTLDGARGHTYEPRLERMYDQFIRQSEQWLNEDPNAQIRIVSIGFSRGAEQAAGFSRLVHDRGIQDPLGAERTRGGEVNYTKPALVEPGQVVQAVGLFDPVGTGVPRDYDRRLPPSVISGFQITAEDERRNQFKSTHIIDPGFQENNHFLNVTVGGAHSNIGGSYTLNGLGVRSNNLMTDYLNSLSDKPFLQKLTGADRSCHECRASFGRTSCLSTAHGILKETMGVFALKKWPPEALHAPVCRLTTKSRVTKQWRSRFPNAECQLHRRSRRRQIRHNHKLRLDPTQPAHPDHALYRQSQSAVGKLDQSMGRTPDTASERMAASLTVLAKQEGFAAYRQCCSESWHRCRQAR